MKTVQELREKDADMFGDRDRHESYGMISLSRISSTGVPAYGSSIKHNSLIGLRIHHSEKSRDIYTDHYFPKGTIVDLYMTPAQFTNLIAGFNTTGVPCTLTFVKGEGTKEAPPENKVREEMVDDIDRHMKKIRNHVLDMKAMADDLLSKKGQFKVSEKKELANILHGLVMEVTSNMRFLEKCQKEKLEKSVSEAHAEVEVTINNKVTALGIESLNELKQVTK